MTTEATIGYGSLFKRGDGATPEIFTAIAEVRSVEPPASEADDVDVTNLDSPDRTKEYIQGLLEGGECSLEMNFLPTNATQNATTGMLADKAAGTVKNWQMLFSDAADTTVTFPGYVKAFKPDSVTPGEALTASATIKVTGPLVWA